MVNCESGKCPATHQWRSLFTLPRATPKLLVCCLILFVNTTSVSLQSHLKHVLTAGRIVISILIRCSWCGWTHWHSLPIAVNFHQHASCPRLLMTSLHLWSFSPSTAQLFRQRCYSFILLHLFHFVFNFSNMYVWIGSTTCSQPELFSVVKLGEERAEEQILLLPSLVCKYLYSWTSLSSLT